MAFQIPDAPNIVGSNPVLRDGQQLSPGREIPNFKVDVRDAQKAVENVGNSVADYADRVANIYMESACNQFSHDMITESARLKDQYKGLSANDLYARLEGFAKSRIDDMFGEPKDDGRIRIANPELQSKFKSWASKQLLSYQSQMMNYSASELEKANREITSTALDDTNKMVIGSSYETREIELDNSWDRYLQVARLVSPGMDESYIRGQAARYMDDAVATKIKGLASSNPDTAMVYVKDPVVNQYLTSGTIVSCIQDIRKGYDEWLPNEIAIAKQAGDESRLAELENIDKIKEVYALDDGQAKAKIEDLLIEADKKYTARQNVAKSMQANVAAGISKDIVSLRDTPAEMQPQKIMDVAYRLEQMKAGSGDKFLKSREKYESDLYTMKLVEDYPDILDEDKEMNDYIDQMYKDHPEMTSDEVLNKAYEVFWGNPQDYRAHQSIAAKVRQIEEEQATWANSREYREYLNKANNGIWNGEPDDTVQSMPYLLQENLYHAAASYNEFKKVKLEMPKIESLVSNKAKEWKKTDSLFESRLRSQVTKAVSQWRKDRGSYPDDEQLKVIINQEAMRAEDPFRLGVSDTINKFGVEYINSLGKSMDLDGEEVARILKDLGNSKFDNSLSYADRTAEEFSKQLKKKKGKVKAKSDLYKDQLDLANNLVTAIIESVGGRKLTDRIEPNIVNMFANTLINTGDIDPLLTYLEGINLK